MEVCFKKISYTELSPEIIRRWADLLSSSSNLYKMYQSPQWWAHLLKGGDHPDYVLIAAEDSVGTIKGIIPLKKSTIKISVTFKKYEITISSFDCLEVLGGQLLLPHSEELYSELLQWIWGNFKNIDGVYFKSIIKDSFDWQFMEGKRWNINGSLVYKFSNTRSFYFLKATETFDEYLATQFKKKKRYNLKRQVRLLEEAAQKEMRIESISDPRDVPEFNKHVKYISQKSWKAKVLNQFIPYYVQDDDILTDLASRDLLRAYLLLVDGKPVTYVLGFQYQDVYHYSDIGFDEDFARYSPGSTLLFLLIEDLIENTELKFINFGIGDSEYKKQFANDNVSDNSLIILRNTLSNRLSFSLNETIKQAKEKLKAFVK